MPGCVGPDEPVREGSVALASGSIRPKNGHWITPNHRREPAIGGKQ
jgi:hypothetical protein